MLLIGLWLISLARPVAGAEVMPPKPAKFFNDEAHVVPQDVASRLNEQLSQYERDSSSQLLVAVYAKMQTGSSIEDFTTRIYHAWGVGAKGKDNGAVLFVFVQDHKMRIQTGYGLEASLTDSECFRIIEEMKPYFRTNDYTGGFSHAVSAMIAATKGEYKGTGKTIHETENAVHDELVLWFVVAFFVIVFALNIYGTLRRARKGYVYRSTGRYNLPGDSGWFGGGWSSGGGSWGGGDWGGGGGGGGSSWSGGGGDTGGGGASGSW